MKTKIMFVVGIVLSLLIVPGVYAGYSGQFTDGVTAANVGGSFTTTVRVTNTSGSGSGSGTVTLSINTDYLNTTDSLSKTCSFGGGSTCEASWTLTTLASHYGLGFSATGTFGSDSTGSVSHGNVIISIPTTFSKSFTDNDADNTLTASQAVTLTLTVENIGSSNGTAVTTLSLTGLTRSSGNATYNDTIQPSASVAHTWIVTNANTASSPTATINISGSDPKSQTITFSYTAAGNDTGTAAAAGGGGGGGVTAAAAKTKSKKHELVPGKGIISNTKLLDAITKVLAKEKLSEQAKQNLLTLSASITQNTEVNRSFEAKDNKTTVTSKVKYKGEKAKSFIVYEKIPKTFAQNHANLTISASGASLKVVEEDPEYIFTYPEVSKNQELTITYSVAKELNTTVLDEFGSPELYAESVEGAAVATVLACTPNAKRCTGNILEVCSADGSAWTTEEACTYGCDSVKFECKPSAAAGVFGPGADYTWYIVGVVVVVVIVAAVLAKKKKMF